MRRTIRVSAVQLPAEVSGRSFAARQRNNRALIMDALTVAGRRGSDLVLLGEYANLSHRSTSTRRSEYVPDPVPGALTRMASRLARRYRMNVALPLLGIWRGVTASYTVFIGRDGRIAGVAQKTHPTVQEQKLGMRPGTSLEVVTLDCCRVGTMLCMDIEYPETAQVLMLRGAELLLFPHVQAGWGEPDWEVRYRARAVDTGLPLVSASYGYAEGEWSPGKILGRSGVVGRDGLIVTDMGRAIGVSTVEIDLGQGRVTHFFFEHPCERTHAVIASRRPELYGALTEQAPVKQARGTIHHRGRRRR